MKQHSRIAIIALLCGLSVTGRAQDGGQNSDLQKQIDRRFEALDHRLDQLAKAIDDVLWYDKVGDVATIEKVFIAGPPPAHVKNPTAMGAKNPILPPTTMRQPGG